MSNTEVIENNGVSFNDASFRLFPMEKKAQIGMQQERHLAHNAHRAADRYSGDVLAPL